MSGRTIFTVGHGVRSLDELVATLRAAGVGRLVDVRRFPGSRRHPQFGSDALAASLPAQGIDYAWWGEALGGRRRSTGGASRHPAWRVEAFRAYADHMDSEAFREALAALEATARRGPPLCVMCAETLWWRCHRRLLADALVVDGFEVTHLLDARTREPHRLHEQLRVDGQGRPVYDRRESLDLDAPATTRRAAGLPERRG